MEKLGNNDIRGVLELLEEQRETLILLLSPQNLPHASLLGHFPFVRSDWPDHSRHNENFTFNQNYPATFVKF